MSGVVDGAGTMLDLVRGNGPMTISELAAALEVSRSTVVQRLEALIHAGLVAPEDPVAGTRGRPANGYRFVPQAGLVLTTHTGLTRTMLGLFDLAGELVAERRLPTDIDGPLEDFVDRIAGARDELLAELGRDGGEVIAAAAGFPGSLEIVQHRHAVSSAEDWDVHGFRRLVEERLGMPVLVDRDVDLMGAGERATEWPDAEVLVCVKAGTAISAAIVVDGRPIGGADGLAGEFGHVKIDGSEAPCVCGGAGCLDAVAGGAALVRELARQGFHVADTRDVVALAERGEPAASAAIRTAGRRVGEALASVVDLLNPRVICAWGYLADADTPFFAGIRETLSRRALPASTANLALVRTRHGETSGLHAAAATVLARVLDPAAIEARLRTDNASSAVERGFAPEARPPEQTPRRTRNR